MFAAPLNLFGVLASFCRFASLGGAGRSAKASREFSRQTNTYAVRKADADN
jgi:hypothetical protein